MPELPEVEVVKRSLTSKIQKLVVEKITVKDLLCHTAGMFGFKGGIPVNNWKDWRQYTRLLENQSTYCEPGKIQAYHALTFGWLVGELIRRVDGRTVGEYF